VKRSLSSEMPSSSRPTYLEIGCHSGPNYSGWPFDYVPHFCTGVLNSTLQLVMVTSSAVSAGIKVSRTSIEAT